MHILASKFIYPPDTVDILTTLKPFQDTSIQLAFFSRQDFLKMNHRAIKEACDKLNITSPTIHAPTADVFHDDFEVVLSTIKDAYKASLISIHPKIGDMALAMDKLNRLAPIVRSLGLTLAYENFPSREDVNKKWIFNPYDMYQKFEQDFLKITFDTSHLDDPSLCIEIFKKVKDKVAVIHLSDYNDKGQHQILGTGVVPYKEFLGYLASISFKGPVVIEYMGEYENRLVEDVKTLQKEYANV